MVEQIEWRSTFEGRSLRRVNAMRLFRIVRETEAQDLAEYAILLTLISLALIAALTLIGVSLSAMFTNVAGWF